MKNIEDVKILVIGDIMRDLYRICDINRISNEAPVPVCHIQKEYSNLGGCGNVINNLISIGVTKVSCISRIGNDISGDYIKSKLDLLNISHNLIIDKNIPTIQKERIISKEQGIQILRIDTEIIKPCVNYFNTLESIDDTYDIIIVSDYAKGVITEDLMNVLKKSNTKIVVDPKPKNINLYKGVFSITPNKKEFEIMKDHLSFYIENNEIQNIINTLGKDGIKIFSLDENKNLVGNHIESKPVDVYNVSGAGDTVVAVFSTCVAMGYDIISSSKVAVECAEWTVTQPGTSSVPKCIFNSAIRSI